MEVEVGFEKFAFGNSYRNHLELTSAGDRSIRVIREHLVTLSNDVKAGQPKNYHNTLMKIIPTCPTPRTPSRRIINNSNS